MEFKARIKVLREEKELSLADLASKLGKSESACRAWETGRTKPDADTLLVLTRLFDTTIDYLLGASDSRTFSYEGALDIDIRDIEKNVRALEAEKKAMSACIADAAHQIQKAERRMEDIEDEIVSLLDDKQALLDRRNNRNISTAEHDADVREKQLEHARLENLRAQEFANTDE